MGDVDHVLPRSSVLRCALCFFFFFCFFTSISEGCWRLKTCQGGMCGSQILVWSESAKLSYWNTGCWTSCPETLQFSRSVESDSLQPHGLQPTRLPCPSPTPRACSNSCPSSWWCHPIISSSVVPFFSCLQSFPALRSFPVSQFFTSGGQSIGVSVSASVLPMNIQDWFPLGWTGLISLQSKGLSRVFSNTTVQKHRFFGA